MMKAGLSLSIGVLFIVAGFPVAAGEKDKGDFDPAKLIGKWQYVSGEKGGAKIDQAELKDQTVTITKDTWTLKGKDTFVIKYTVDAKKDPATIKMEITKGPDFAVGSKSAGIIELKGDELRICYAAEGDAAPKKFATKEGTKDHLFVLKRAK
jgi:uncharacterized protein (TIGR03067 family)